MEEFKGNSNASKQEAAREPIAPVTSDVKVKKENSLAKKFFAQDAKSTARGVNDDIIIPGLKNLIVNILKKSVDYLFLGRSAQTGSYTNYGSAYPSRSVSYGPTPTFGMTAPIHTQQRSSIYAVNDILFNERGEAEEVLARMNELIVRYGMVSVLDFYDLINQSKMSNPTDNKYGWKDLNGAKVDRSLEGYRILFPKVIPLE